MRSPSLIDKLLVCVAAVLVSISGVAQDEAPLAPDWTLDAADGTNITFQSDLAKGPAVLVFWASWCPYCRALFPHLEAVRADYQAHGVPFYALNIWEDGDPAAYFAEHGYAMILIPAADLVAEDYGVKGTPSVYVTDAAQRIVYQRRSGEDPQDVARNVSAALDAALRLTPARN